MDYNNKIHKFMHPNSGEKMFIPKGFKVLERNYMLWDNIMLVVDKIESLTNNLKPDGILLKTFIDKIESGHRFSIVFNQHPKIFAEHPESKKQAVYNGICLFIDWFNQQGK